MKLKNIERVNAAVHQTEHWIICANYNLHTDYESNPFYAQQLQIHPLHSIFPHYKYQIVHHPHYTTMKNLSARILQRVHVPMHHQ